jgi:hypothetical protein
MSNYIKDTTKQEMSFMLQQQAKKIQAFEIELMERNIEVEMLKRDVKLLRIANRLSKVGMTQKKI